MKYEYSALPEVVKYIITGGITRENIAVKISSTSPDGKYDIEFFVDDAVISVDELSKRLEDYSSYRDMFAYAEALYNHLDYNGIYKEEVITFLNNAFPVDPKPCPVKITNLYCNINGFIINLNKEVEKVYLHWETQHRFDYNDIQDSIIFFVTNLVKDEMYNYFGKEIE